MLVSSQDDTPAMLVTVSNFLNGKEYTVPKKKIYIALPHIVADNHFSGDNVMQYTLEVRALGLPLHVDVIISQQD